MEDPGKGLLHLLVFDSVLFALGEGEEWKEEKDMKRNERGPEGAEPETRVIIVISHRCITGLLVAKHGR